jgi:catechol 2,3-dioxygenase-like lactoylglutathione lyase family enzyme
MVLGLATVIYRVSDLERAKAWYSAAFQQQPYFDQPFYVGFNIAGYELGFNPIRRGTSLGPAAVSHTGEWPTSTGLLITSSQRAPHFGRPFETWVTRSRWQRSRIHSATRLV